MIGLLAKIFKIKRHEHKFTQYVVYSGVPFMKCEKCNLHDPIQTQEDIEFEKMLETLNGKGKLTITKNN